MREHRHPKRSPCRAASFPAVAISVLFLSVSCATLELPDAITDSVRVFDSGQMWLSYQVELSDQYYEYYVAEFEKAEKRYSEMMDSAGKEREMAANRIIAQARLQAREKVRNARDDNISLCFERAKEEIRIIRHSEKYPSVLEFLIENGIQELEENNVVLDICSEDMPIIRELIPKFESKGYNLLV